MVTSLGPGLPTSSTPINGNGNASRSLGPVLQPDEIAQLLPVALTNATQGGTIINFPCVLFKHSQKKSLVIHKYPNLDSGRIENMGRDPAVFFVRIILTNNIFPGTNEDWIAGQLFPNGYNQQGDQKNVFEELIKMLDDNTEKVLVHPVLGNINCQVSSYTYDLNAKGPRDGAYVEVELIETISQYTPITQQLTNQLVLTNAANNLANAFNFQGASPPGLSMTQLVGALNNRIRQAIAYPNNVVNALNAPFLTAQNAVTSISSAIVSSPAYTANGVLQTIQNTKNSVLNAQVQNAISYDESTYQAVQAALSLNNTACQNGSQLLSKSITMYNTMMQYYINQNNSIYSQIIEALRQYIYQLQQALNSLTQNVAGTNQTAKVATYLTQNTMTWMQLSSLLKNNIDSLMSLNQPLVNSLWIGANVTIYYYQS